MKLPNDGTAQNVRVAPWRRRIPVMATGALAIVTMSAAAVGAMAAGRQHPGDCTGAPPFASVPAESVAPEAVIPLPRADEAAEHAAERRDCVDVSDSTPSDSTPTDDPIVDPTVPTPTEPAPTEPAPTEPAPTEPAPNDSTKPCQGPPEFAGVPAQPADPESGVIPSPRAAEAHEHAHHRACHGHDGHTHDRRDHDRRDHDRRDNDGRPDRDDDDRRDHDRRDHDRRDNDGRPDRDDDDRRDNDRRDHDRRDNDRRPDRGGRSDDGGRHDNDRGRDGGGSRGGRGGSGRG